MRKTIKRFLAGILAAGLCLGAAGCNGLESGKDSLVYLDYGTGINDDGNYNTELYGMNIKEPQGGDPSMFYVSEEEDPVYGGYYYMYSGGTGSAEEYKKEHISVLAVTCYRSKDMYQWELCGAMDGMCVAIDEEDWCQMHQWGPCVVRNPADGKYYCYFSSAIVQNYGVASLSSSSYDWDRLYIAVSVSDSPMGPFDVLYDTDAATGKRMPTINFQTGCQTKYPWAVIDPAPFYDDDGTLYMYFNKHPDDHYTELNGVFGMKMKSMTIPDYSTVTCLTQGGYYRASNTPGKIELEDVKGEDPYFSDEIGINEAPYMYKHNGTYYLTYASNGYGMANYSVHQAIGDSPLGTFVKPSEESGNPVLDGSRYNFVHGTASHSILERDGEIWIVYHRNGSVNSYEEGWERSVSVDRLNLVKNKDGQMVLSANGPSKSLQWLPESVSGYQNLAQTAEIELSAGTGAEYLTDTVLPFYEVTKDYVMSAEGDVTITMKWQEPVSVTSLMIYNAENVEKAFSKISDIRFKLAEKPSWASKSYDYAVIKDLKFPDRYWNPETERYIVGAPAVAEFEEMAVSEIQITIKAGERLMEFNKFGEPNAGLILSEIVVLGRSGSNE